MHRRKVELYEESSDENKKELGKMAAEKDSAVTSDSAHCWPDYAVWNNCNGIGGNNTVAGCGG